jgi:DNA processing protein
VSALSLGVIVVEAAHDSGVFSTVRWALDQGTEVFAVPGNITASTSAGTNRLIREGAKMVTCVEDILEELRPREATRADVHSPPAVELSPQEEQLRTVLSSSPQHIDAIADSTGLPIPQALSILLALEIKGAARQLAGKMFVRTGS